MLPLILTALVGIVLGIMVAMLAYTHEWMRLYTKLAQLRQENASMSTTIQKLNLEISLRDRGATFEED